MSLFRKRRRGASAIEFGLTLPVLLVIFSAVVEYGMVFFHQSALIGAVRDGTRFGTTVLVADDPENEATTRARQVLTGYNLSCANVQTCTITAQLLYDSTFDYWFLDVSIDRQYEPIVGLLPVPSEVHSHMAMLIEDQVID